MMMMMIIFTCNIYHMDSGPDHLGFNFVIRTTAVAPIRPLTWEPPHAEGVALKKKKDKKREQYLAYTKWYIGFAIIIYYCEMVTAKCFIYSFMYTEHRPTIGPWGAFMDLVLDPTLS